MPVEFSVNLRMVNFDTTQSSKGDFLVVMNDNNGSHKLTIPTFSPIIRVFAEDWSPSYYPPNLENWTTARRNPFYVLLITRLVQKSNHWTLYTVAYHERRHVGLQTRVMGSSFHTYLTIGSGWRILYILAGML
ncbi:2 3-bisphosphoglycerate-independent phosphoglycerate mutase [Bienertia sinuspersici]